MRQSGPTFDGYVYQWGISDVTEKNNLTKNYNTVITIIIHRKTSNSMKKPKYYFVECAKKKTQLKKIADKKLDKMISKCLNHMVVTSIVMEHSWHFFFRHTILVLFVIKVYTSYNDFNWMNLNAHYLFYYIRFGHVKFFWSGLHTSQWVLFDVILHTVLYLSNYCQNQDV